MKLSVMTNLPNIGTDEKFGALICVFHIVYGVFSPIGDCLADRFNRSDLSLYRQENRIIKI